MRETFLGAMAAAAVVLIGYQVGMLVWTKRTVGHVPTSILILRGVNIAVLLAGSALVISRLAGE